MEFFLLVGGSPSLLSVIMEGLLNLSATPQLAVVDFTGVYAPSRCSKIGMICNCLCHLNMHIAKWNKYKVISCDAPSRC